MRTRTGLTIDYTLAVSSFCCHCLIAVKHRRGGAPLVASSHPHHVSVTAAGRKKYSSSSSYLCRHTQKNPS
ncbi:hypothetical protein L6452_03655 [Arctium lappa]|uniref:Uncharacterized protein n=1 Tax=Arctium lappa TaxID=4217 RepID=A0ACB9FMH0_ARCLA|nr:hypothetical protein L6452_03655 [Arctium lappa]